MLYIYINSIYQQWYFGLIPQLWHVLFHVSFHRMFDLCSVNTWSMIWSMWECLETHSGTYTLHTNTYWEYVSVTYVLTDCIMNSPIVQSEHQTADLLWSLHIHVTRHFLWHVVEHPVQSPGHFLSVQPHVQPQVSSAHRVEGCCDVSKRYNVHWKHTNTHSHTDLQLLYSYILYILYIYSIYIYAVYLLYILYIYCLFTVYTVWTFGWSFS